MPFSIQRAKGTGWEQLSEKEKAAKLWCDSIISHLDSFVDLREFFSKMTQANQEAPVLQLPPELALFMQSVSQQMATFQAFMEEQMAKPAKKTSRQGREIEVLSEDEVNLEDHEESSEAYLTSSTDDKDCDTDRMENRVKMRTKRKKKRQKKKKEEEAKGLSKSGPPKTTLREPGTLERRSTKDVSNEEYCDYLEELARIRYREDYDKWGACPVIGYGQNVIMNENPPILTANCTGPEFDNWVRKWRFYIERNASGVHPKLMGNFLINQIQNACTDDLWLWVESTLKGATAGEIMRGLRQRVFSRCNMARTFLDITQKPQGDHQTEDQLIQENDSTVDHFRAAYPEGDGLNIFLLLARLKNKRLREKVTQIQDKPYADICKVVIEMGQQMRQTQQLHNRVTGQKEVYTAAATPPNSVEAAESRGRGGHGGYRGGQKGQGGAKRGPKSQTGTWFRSKSSEGRRCSHCGRSHEQGKCPANGKECFNCGKMNHFAPVCRSGSRSKSQQRSSSENRQDRGRSPSSRRGPNSSAQEAETRASYLECISMLEVDTSSNEETTELSYSDALTKGIPAKGGKHGNLNQEESEVSEAQKTTPRRGKKVDNTVKPLDLIKVTIAKPDGPQFEADALPDSGANVNIMPISMARRFGIEQTRISDPKCANGSALTVAGKTTTDLVYNDQLYIDVDWQVAEASRIILSKGLLSQMGLLPQQFPFVTVANIVHQAQEEVKTALTSATVKICNDEEVNAIASKYPEVFCGRVTMMKGKPASIELSNDATPTSTGHYRTIANAYLEPLKKELDTQVAAGIMEKMGEKPEAAKFWLHPIVVVPKKGTTDVRLCVDFRKLNKFCLRPTNPQKTPLETVRSLPKGERYFAVCDALKGYHQIALDEESMTKTAFFTPFGIYRYKSLPMGYAASQDIFTDRFGRAVDDVIQARVTEDCLITATDRQMFLKRLDRFFARCKEHGIVLNNKKFQIGSEVIFGGFKLNSEGYSLDPGLHDAIRKFPPPTNLTELRSFMGLINQTTTFTDKIAELANPLKELLKKRVEFVWTTAHQEAFEKAREELSNPRQLAYFDHRRPTRLYTDASRLNGLGFVVKQLQPEDESWRIVQSGSRFLTSAESRYAMVELEMLAIAWATQKARPFLEGINFEILTDHKPLIPILNDYALSEIENKRLQRLKMKLSGFQFEAFHIPGKENTEADALSRAPVCQPTPEDEIDEDGDEELKTSKTAVETLNAVESEANQWSLSSETLEFEAHMVDLLREEVREAAEDDTEYRTVKGWVLERQPPAAHTISHQLKPYYKGVDRFTVDEDGLLCYDDRLVIPRSLRSRFIDHLVHLHASPAKMISRARKSVWWPLMAKEIEQRWRTCRTCVENSPSNKPEPVKPREISKYPFQIIHMDLGTYSGNQYLVIVDQFSGWPIVKELKREATTDTVKKCLVDMFQHYGLPESIVSDGGPQFESLEFKDFCNDWKINHVTSSPHYPQSNGIAENGIKAMKKLIHCCFNPAKNAVDSTAWAKALMLYKNTPRGSSSLSPSEILFGKLLRDGLHSSYDTYIPEHKAAVKRRIDEAHRYTEQLYNFRESSSKVQMSIGDRVFIQCPQTLKWKFTGTIEKPGRNEREFWVRTDRGGLWRRNRRFLKLQDPFKRGQGWPGQAGNEKSTSGSDSEDAAGSNTPRGQPRRSTTRRTEMDVQQEPRRSTRNRKQVVRFGY